MIKAINYNILLLFQWISLQKGKSIIFQSMARAISIIIEYKRKEYRLVLFEGFDKKYQPWNDIFCG